MPVYTKRWNDPPSPEDGFRLLVTRYRPRGVASSDETWAEWWPELGPSRALHAAAYGKGEGQDPIPFAEYQHRYLEEMQRQVFRIRALGDRAAAGETITLLCSSACTDPARCHRTLLQGLVNAAAAGRQRR